MQIEQGTGVVRNSRRLIQQNIKKTLQNYGSFFKSTMLDQQKNRDVTVHPKPQISAKERKKSEDLSMFQFAHKTREVLSEFTFEDLFETDPRKKLGEGAQSVVRLCREKSTGFQYAVKLFRNTSQELAIMLKTQYKLLRSLKHENIVKCYYFFHNQHQNCCHLIMEYVQFPDLRHYLSKESILAQAKVVEIVIKVVKTLAYMHSKGFAHRDVKLDNILYNPLDDDIKLIDFEISKQFKGRGCDKEMWTKTGTPNYCAPEMFEGSHTESVDVWAVGVLTYNLLTGSPPFVSTYEKDLQDKIINSEPEYSVSMSGFAQDFIKRCLSKKAEHRPKMKSLLILPFLITCKSQSWSPSSSRLNQSFELGSQNDKEQSMDHYYFQAESKISDNFMGTDIGIRKIISSQ